jgi:hypothetical protein
VSGIAKSILGDSAKEEHHLLGAYSFAVEEPIDFATHGLIQAGAWNYLREEITVALQCRRRVRMGRIFDSHTDYAPADDMHANHISLLLARIINFSFPDLSEYHSQRDRITLWKILYSALMDWKASLPASFEPFSTAPKLGNAFPSLWMLEPWHGTSPLETIPQNLLMLLLSGRARVFCCCRDIIEFVQPRSFQWAHQPGRP